MYEKMEPLKISTVCANIPDLDAVLSVLYTRLKLAPFLRFDLEATEGVTPVAFIRIGEHTMELLGRIKGERPQSGVIHCVEIEAPGQEKTEIELAPETILRCCPGEQIRLRAIEIMTSLPKEDAAAFIDYTGATMAGPENSLDLCGIAIRLVETEGIPPKELPGLFFPGWHRLSVHVPSVSESYETMSASGSSLESLVEPFQVMPGHKEAMLSLPSHVILQLTEESFLKMTPSLAVEWVKSKFSGHRMRFNTRGK
ncbi:hypothetical protein U27_06407 [Candidatus Vecturithrix granuli]|uniref:Uncharacterized protein n=1 Tax=Vecturithrix granuli TaxID=1499967 RepID=A0A081C4B8_VECG1|nr:hypothetical protein U27_06407 [Candidatus Vecturithrix granuli]